MRTLNRLEEDSKRLALASQVGADGFQLLAELFAKATPLEVRAEPAVEVLRQVWLQQVDAGYTKLFGSLPG